MKSRPGVHCIFRSPGDSLGGRDGNIPQYSLSVSAMLYQAFIGVCELMYVDEDESLPCDVA